MKIGKKDKFNASNLFDLRLKQLDDARHATESEKQAAIIVYERLLTAKAIVLSLSPEAEIDNKILISVFEALGYESESLAPEDTD